MDIFAGFKYELADQKSNQGSIKAQNNIIQTTIEVPQTIYLRNI
jgi:hypothetical protein